MPSPAFMLLFFFIFQLSLAAEAIQLVHASLVIRECNLPES